MLIFVVTSLVYLGLLYSLNKYHENKEYGINYDVKSENLGLKKTNEEQMSFYISRLDEKDIKIIDLNHKIEHLVSCKLKLKEGIERISAENKENIILANKRDKTINAYKQRLFRRERRIERLLNNKNK